jgi:hypothetical protein
MRREGERRGEDGKRECWAVDKQLQGRGDSDIPVPAVDEAVQGQ